MNDDLPLSVTLEVYSTCLCMHTQRAARALGRVFDHALKPFGLTHGQFSLMMALNRPDAPLLSEVADLLGMDRTSLTAKLKALEKRGLVSSAPDETDRRGRRLTLTLAGQEALISALPAWRATHEMLNDQVNTDEQSTLKSLLGQIASTPS